MYRERPYPCPQCGVELVRYETRETRQCKKCYGLLVPFAELEIDAGPFAEGLITGESPSISNPTRPCPVCSQQMTKLELDPFVLDRCDADRVVWFDHDELQGVAGKLENANWVQRLLERR